MPRRLLSVRGRKREHNDLVVDPPEYFDFDFRREPAVFVQNSTRPTTSGATDTGRNLQRTTSQSRPQTSGGLKRVFDKRLHLAKAEDNCIGVALGSPTHPPSSWRHDPSPISPDHAFRYEGPFPSGTPSKWKKIGGLFKPKSVVPVNQSRPGIVDQTTDHSQLSPPNQSSPSAQQTIINTPEFEITAVPVESPKKTLSRLPKLEVEIPSIEMDRYSVMFRDINGISSTNLMARRSKIHADLKALQLKEATAELPSLPAPSPRRMTTPSMPRVSYSPFPPPPPPKAGITDSPSKKNSSIRGRSVSAPAASPCRPTFPDLASKEASVHQTVTTAPGDGYANQGCEQRGAGSKIEAMGVGPQTNNQGLEIFQTMKQGLLPETDSNRADNEDSKPVKPAPLRLRRTPRRGSMSDDATSPEDVASRGKDETPWLSTDSLKSTASSQTTIDDEIFFDVKALRDSRDQDSQFIISKPDSAAVEIARSISKKNKTQNIQKNAQYFATHQEPYCMPPDLQAAEIYCNNLDPEHELRLSMFDQVIAEVEKLASPSDVVTKVSYPDQPRHLHLKPQIGLSSRPQGLAIGIPSPITERPEEETPEVDLGPAPFPRHIASQLSPKTTSPQSISSAFNMPPPVPEKDPRYLPLSKYAIHRKPLDPTTNSTIRPHIQKRSVTEPSISNLPTSTQTSKRSSSLPSPISKPAEKILAVAAHPTAEVSIARTISLSRKTSHQVLVSRTPQKSVTSSPPNSVARTASIIGKSPVLEDGEKLHTEKRAMSPVVLEVPKGHKHGASLRLVLEEP